MAEQTLREKNIAACMRHGFVQVNHRTTKYICYKHPREDKWYFLGVNGAVRLSRTGKIADSISVRFGTTFMNER